MRARQSQRPRLMRETVVWLKICEPLRALVFFRTVLAFLTSYNALLAVCLCGKQMPRGGAAGVMGGGHSPMLLVCRFNNKGYTAISLNVVKDDLYDAFLDAV
eukprot:148682-Prorocentrum_minimum.AAC.2